MGVEFHVVDFVAAHAGLLHVMAQGGEVRKGRFKTVLSAHHAHVDPVGFLNLAPVFEGRLAVLAAVGCGQAGDDLFGHAAGAFLDGAVLGFGEVVRYGFARQTAIDAGFADTVAAQPVGPVYAAGVLTGHEELVQGGPAFHVDDSPAHEEVGRWRNRHHVVREIVFELGAAFCHTGEVAEHEIRAEVGRVDAHAAFGAGATGHHFQIGRTADHVAGGAFGDVRRVLEHVALAFAVIEVGARAAQPFFKQGTGYHAAGNDEPRRVELDHFHVAHPHARPVEHGDAVSRLFGAGSVKTVLGRPAAGSHQRGRGFHDDEVGVAHVVEQSPGYGLAFGVQQQLHGTRFFQHGNPPFEDLLGGPADDFDARQVALVDRAVEALAGEGLLMNMAVRAAIKEAAADGFQFLDRGRGLFHQLQGQVLIVDILPTLQRIHEVLFMGIARIEHYVETALDHAAASPFALQCFGGNEDVQVRVGVMGIDGRQFCGGSHAQHQ